MRLAALFSGGKDSTYAIMLMEQMGHEVTHLITIVPKDPYAMLFHTLNLNLIPLQAESMGKALVRVGSSGEEAADLAALKAALASIEVEGVITGAIASDYQWDRINGVCEDLGLRCFSPMWRKEQETLLRDMADGGLKAIIVGTFAEGLDKRWLGIELDHKAIDSLVKLRTRFSVNVSGEGGEYESLVLDSPMHSRPIEIIETRVEEDINSSRLRVTDARLGDR
ncbi:MAG: ATP-binding region [Methanomassiliicoccales archaeon PtaU1.Bin124]|nr:MAG: ATP-binding region [Methanomassiliicoccales archaeon PtaU1.Bin124]